MDNSDQQGAINGILQLKKGRDKPVIQRHPWVYSGAVAHVIGDPQPGDTILIQNHRQKPLAIGYYNPHSQIVVRICTWDPDQPLSEGFWREKITRAYTGRQLLAFDPETNGYRLIFGETDGIPGLIVDRYANYLVMQCLTLGIDCRKETFVNILKETPLPDGTLPVGILERSDVAVRAKENLPQSDGLLWGKAPAESVTVKENGFSFEVDLIGGHKTGFYLDQRDNRQLLTSPSLTAGKEVLNVFAYTGGFAVTGAAGGATSILNIDTSISALELAEKNVLANFPERVDHDEYLAGDAFQILRDFRDSGRTFDLIVLDPPKFVHGRRDLQRASRGYKDINWLGMRLLKPGGILMTFSCSGLVSIDLFQKIIFGAAVDAGREVQILRHLHQGADHPILVTFPESAYLKGFLCRVW